jgi:PIN domain nuclease of toxin-antitoxin system
MKLLLDTHTFLWLVDGNPKLGAAASTAINDMQNLLYLSVVSIWELAIKTSRANPQLQLVDPLDIFVERWTRLYGISILSIERSHALQVVNLPDHHRDPFDRLLVAQANIESMHLLTGDSKLAAYSIPIIW